jgi:hypothetical protein
MLAFQRGLFYLPRLGLHRISGRPTFAYVIVAPFGEFCEPDISLGKD